jgi:hypothetical protein
MGFANVFVNDDDVETAADIIRDYENADKLLEAPFDAHIEQKPA